MGKCMGLMPGTSGCPTPTSVMDISDDGLSARGDVGVDMIDLDNLLSCGSVFREGLKLRRECPLQLHGKAAVLCQQVEAICVAGSLQHVLGEFVGLAI